MALVQTLQESSEQPIGNLKKILSKDDRVKQVLQSHLDIDDIANKGEFLNTLKFFVLNNRNVLQFVSDRSDIKDLSKTVLKNLRELRPADLKQSDVDKLVDFVKALLREYSHVDRAGISPELRKRLVDWANANGTYFDLPGWAQRELMSVPGLRPTRPTLLYRGLLFNSYDLKERKRYDGTLEVGKGLKFLRAVREGTRVVDLEWDRASSWTTSKQTAMQFARFSSQNSTYAATMNWLQRGDKKIDGDLGFIISTLAQPEDILIDMARLKTAAHIKHGDEGEMILKPGTYTCRIITKYTQKGEVDPIETGKIDETVQEAIDATRKFAESWEVPDVSEHLSHWGNIDIGNLLEKGKLESFVALARPSTREQAVNSMKQLQEFYNEHIDSLTDGQLETLVADRKIGKLAEWITELRKFMNEERKHSAYKTDKNSTGRVSRKSMTADHIRESGSSHLYKTLDLATGRGRFTDRSIGVDLNKIMKGLGGEPNPDIHRKSRKDQEDFVDSIMAKFFSAIGVDQPENKEEALKKIKSVILGAERNASLLSSLHSKEEALKKALNPSKDDENE